MLILITRKGWINLLKEFFFRIDLVLYIDNSVIQESTPVTFLHVKVDGVTCSLGRTISSMWYFIYNVHLLGSPRLTDFRLGLVRHSFRELLLILEIDDSLDKHKVNVKILLPDFTHAPVLYFTPKTHNNII